MNESQNRVAVVTGGASGIGRALAKALLGESMKVVLADVESDRRRAFTDRARKLAAGENPTGVIPGM